MSIKTLEPEKSTMTRIRNATVAKLDPLAKVKGWKRVEAIDRAADALLEKEGIETAAGDGGRSGSRKKTRQASAA